MGPSRGRVVKTTRAVPSGTAGERCTAPLPTLPGHASPLSKTTSPGAAVTSWGTIHRASTSSRLRMDADASAVLTLAPGGQLLQARIEYAAAVLGDGRILVAGGSITHETNDSGLSVAEIYNPVLGTSVATTHSMTVARAGLTATLLRDGKVLLVGGNDANGNPLASAELYDPASDTFTATQGTMSCARFAHDATLLADGRVLITGGWSSPPTATSLNLCTSAEVYNPALDAFVQTAAPTTGRVYHTATLLPSGKVLVAGGATSIAPTDSDSSGTCRHAPVRCTDRAR